MFPRVRATERSVWKAMQVLLLLKKKKESDASYSKKEKEKRCIIGGHFPTMKIRGGHNPEDFERSEIKPICQEILEVADSFESCEIVFVHVGWWPNEAAHLCGAQPSENRRRCLWVNYILAFLSTCNLKRIVILLRKQL